jgi:hypothetical protein
LADAHKPVTHALRAVEELLLSAADSLALIRERDSDAGSLERTVHDLAELVASWVARGEGRALRSVRTAVRSEMQRWEVRAGDDPAAHRVYELFAALDDLLGDDEDAPQRATASARPPPRRSSHRAEPR